jgi:hypothetical protein
MKCFHHKDSEAIGVCTNCGKGVCEKCISFTKNGKSVCSETCCTFRNNFDNSILSTKKKTNTQMFVGGIVFIGLSIVFAISAVTATMEFGFSGLTIYMILAFLLSSFSGVFTINKANTINKETKI